MLDILIIQSAENMFTYVSYYMGTFGIIHAVFHLSEAESLVEVLKYLILYMVLHPVRSYGFADRL